MGRSFLRGNSGFVGKDRRGESGITGGTGNVSILKHYLERKGGNFTPIPPASKTGILYQQNWENFLGGWLQMPDTLNNWAINSASTHSGTKAALVELTTNNTYVYDSNQDVHLWIDIYIDPAITDISLDYWWRCNGETRWDYGYTWITFTGDTVTAAPRESAADLAKRLGGDTSVASNLVYYRRNNSTYNASASASWVNEPLILLTSGVTQSTTTFVPGEHNRFYFSFTSDGSVENQPPFGVDDLVWSYSASTKIIVNPDDPNS